MGMSLPGRFHKFQAVAPGILGVKSADPRDGSVISDLSAVGEQSLAQVIEVRRGESGMRFLGRVKILFDANVELLSAAFKPASAAGAQRFRLLNFPHAEKRPVELPGGGFAAFGGGEL